MTEQTLAGWFRYLGRYYNEHPRRLAIHVLLTMLTGGGWLFLWGGWLLGGVVVGDWSEP